MNPYHEDNNLDKLRQEKSLMKRELDFEKRKRQELEKRGAKELSPNVKYAVQGLIVASLIGAYVLTGSGWLFVILFLYLAA